jgi:hypothetical protein
MAFASALLLFSAPESAFAHPNHPAAQASSAPVASVELASVSDHGQHFNEFVSAAERHPETCPHGNKHSDCGSCCACSATASVAIATLESTGRELRVRSEGIAPVVPYLVRETILDLSRPPKFFA